MKKTITKILCGTLCSIMLVVSSVTSYAALTPGLEKYQYSACAGLHYGEFGEEITRTAKYNNSEFTGKLVVTLGPKAVSDKTYTIDDFAGIDVTKVENIVKTTDGECRKVILTLKDNSLETVYSAAKTLENNLYLDGRYLINLYYVRNDNNGFERNDDFNFEEYAKFSKEFEAKHGNYNEPTAYEGFVAAVTPELKNEANLTDKATNIYLKLDDDHETYLFKIVAETKNGDEVVKSEYFNCDANNDKLVSITDAVAILKEAAKWDGVEVGEGADADRNGIVNITDATIVLKTVAGWQF